MIEEYALAGAMALVFWTEPVATYDLDVLIWLPQKKGPIVTLAPLYQWLSARGHSATADHVIISGVPVQFLPAHNALGDEAIREAIELDYEGVPVRVVRPEHLIALYLEPSAPTHKRRERAAALAELPTLDRARLDDILARHGLNWQANGSLTPTTPPNARPVERLAPRKDNAPRDPPQLVLA